MSAKSARPQSYDMIMHLARRRPIIAFTSYPDALQTAALIFTHRSSGSGAKDNDIGAKNGSLPAMTAFLSRWESSEVTGRRGGICDIRAREDRGVWWAG